MEVTATAKFLRISPRKARLVADMIRGLETNKALDQLAAANKKAAGPVEKLLRSAVANAVNNFELDKDNLRIKEIRVDEGPTLHRWMPRARGRATPIRKRTSHIKVLLAEIVASGDHRPKKAKIEAPVKLDARPKEEEGVKIGGRKEGDSPKKDEKAAPAKGAAAAAPIIDPREEGRGKHAKIERGARGKGFMGRIFRRKSG